MVDWSSSSCSTVIAEGEGTGISLYLDFTWLCKFFSSNICSQPCRHRTKRLSRNCRTKSEGTLRLSANTGLPQEHTMASSSHWLCMQDVHIRCWQPRTWIGSFGIEWQIWQERYSRCSVVRKHLDYSAFYIVEVMCTQAIS